MHLSKATLGYIAAAVGVGVVVVVAVASRHSLPSSSTNSPASSGSKTNQTSKASLAGTYRCWQFNVNGRMINTTGCRLATPLVLNADGTYSFSSEHGTYKINGDQIVLSESKIRGPGTLKEENTQIYFKYSTNGNQYEVTYLRQAE